MKPDHTCDLVQDLAGPPPQPGFPGSHPTASSPLPRLPENFGGYGCAAYSATGAGCRTAAYFEPFMAERGGTGGPGKLGGGHLLPAADCGTEPGQRCAQQRTEPLSRLFHRNAA